MIRKASKNAPTWKAIVVARLAAKVFAQGRTRALEVLMTVFPNYRRPTVLSTKRGIRVFELTTTSDRRIPDKLYLRGKLGGICVYTRPSRSEQPSYRTADRLLAMPVGC